ncbi:MAG TPA: hypothetical protein VIH72_11045 [Candidatus Acidoferrales bacterium]
MKRAILFAAASLLSSGVAVCIPQAAPVPVPAPNGQMLVQPRAYIIEDLYAKGAPFTAEYIVESKGILRDGTEIHLKRTMMRYRDGEGRTRTETDDMIRIVDPELLLFYNLNKKTLSGTKGTFENPTEEETRAQAQALFEAQQLAAEAAKGGPYVTLGSPVTTESLGTQEMEGLMVQGTRTTTMTRYGQTNGAPRIKVVQERWYSPDLKIDVMVTNDDPRQPTVSVMRYTNIQRTEPDPALFKAPTGYTVTGPNKRQEELQ